MQLSVAEFLAQEAAGRRILLVDLSWILHRSFHSMSGLHVTIKGVQRPSGHVFGAIRTLINWRVRFPDCPAVLCLDAGRGGRASEVAGYKETRERGSYSLSQDIPDILRMSSLLPGVYYSQQDGLEADDVLFSLAHECERRTRQEEEQRGKVGIFLHTGDQDLYQAVTARTMILDRFQVSRVGDFKVIRRADVEEKFGVPPAKLPLLRAVLGDTSDNLPGVPRIQKAAVQRLVALCESPADLFTTEPPEDLTKRQKTSLAVLPEYREQIEANYRCMRLQADPAVPLFRPEDDSERAIKTVKRWKLNSLLSYLYRS